MLLKKVALLSFVCLALGGCTISRHIRDLEPPADEPSLEQLDRHLDYTDPDDGRPDFIIQR